MTEHENKEQQEKLENQDNKVAVPDPVKDPVRKWTFIILALCIVLTTLYLVADRQTPFTTQARVHGFVVPIAPQVAGKVVSVEVSNNDKVTAGQPLFQIDPTNYQQALEAAQASLQAVLQSVESGVANVAAAEANVVSVKASVLRAEQDALRLRNIREEDPGAISERRMEQAEASLTAARGQLAATRASAEATRSALGASDENNAQAQQSKAALDKARVDLERTTVVAPRDGVVTDLRIDVGNFAAAGAPLMTFIATQQVWVRADLTENNLGHVNAGDRVELSFDVQPGKIYQGKVRETGFGVQVASNALGSLPTIDNQRSWLRDAQRFPVIIDIESNEGPGQMGLRVGSQVSVIVYTGDNGLLNSLGRIYIRAVALMSYAY